MKKNLPVKAYWIKKTHLFRADEYFCSACRRAAAKAYKQCPCCGAVMKKSKSDSTWVDEAEMADMFF